MNTTTKIQKQTKTQKLVNILCQIGNGLKKGCKVGLNKGNGILQDTIKKLKNDTTQVDVNCDLNKKTNPKNPKDVNPIITGLNTPLVNQILNDQKKKNGKVDINLCLKDKNGNTVNVTING